MRYKEGTSRDQASIWSLDDMVAEDSMVRVIDRFVELCDLEALGFTRTTPAAVGRPGYAAAPLAKLYVYGYENKIRSSRKLSREAKRNIEAMWLVDSLEPDYKTISEFRRLNVRPLQKLFKEFVKLCRSWDLVGGEVFAIDGSKFKASNNKKNNFSRKKLDDRLRRLDEKISEYMTSIEKADKNEETEPHVPDGLMELLERKELYEGYQRYLEESGENEVSTVDPDARLMGNNRGGVEVAYNVQTAVDGKHNLIVDYDLTMNPADQGQMSIMTKRLIRQGHRRFTLLADKGYYSGSELFKMKKFKIKAVAPRQKPSNPKDQQEGFHTAKFKYDTESDTYICPAGATLHPHNKKTAKRRNFYNKTACGKCPHKANCTRGKNGYRTIVRSEYADVYENADRVFRESLQLYKRRQQIVEPTFGTIKHEMDGRYFLLRRRRKVRVEVALLSLGYNLKRAYNILGFHGIMARLDSFPRRFSDFLWHTKNFGCRINHFQDFMRHLGLASVA